MTGLRWPCPMSPVSEAEPGAPIRRERGVVALLALTHQCRDGSNESRPEPPRFDRPDVGILESSKGLGGKVVVAARLHRGQPWRRHASESAWSRTAST